MSRWIDADALKKDLSENYTFYGFRQLLNDFYEALDSAPSIDIVRCKECVHGTWHEQTEMYICSANDQDLYEAEHFCSYGEREGE